MQHKFIQVTGFETPYLVIDKVKVAIASNPPAGYVEADNYVVVDEYNNVKVINPITITKIISFAMAKTLIMDSMTNFANHLKL